MTQVMVDWWAMTVLAIAAVAVALRGYMLKPGMAKWVTAPTSVWFWLLMLAIVLAGNLLAIQGGSHATGREAVAYSVLAATAVAMLINVARQSAEASIFRQAMDHLDEGARLMVHAAMEEIRRRRGRTS